MSITSSWRRRFFNAFTFATPDVTFLNWLAAVFQSIGLINSNDAFVNVEEHFGYFMRKLSYSVWWSRKGRSNLLLYSDKVIAKALRGLVIVLNNTKLKDFGGENVFDRASFFRAASVLLKDNNMLPTDMLYIAIRTLGSSCPDFNSLVSGLKRTVDRKLKEYSLEQVLQTLGGDYNDKIGSNEWPGKI